MRKLSKLVLFMIFVMFVVTNKVIADTCVGKITESERSGSQVKETVTWNCDDPKYQNTCNFNIEIEDTKFILSFY